MFEWLEPPPGGPARLRRGFESERRRHERVRRAAAPLALAATTAVAGIALLMLLRQPAAEPAWTSSSPLLMALGVTPAPAEPLVVPAQHRGSIAIERVPLPPGRVVFYRVGLTFEEVAAEAEAESATQ